jgi:thiosulfate/3-mercaptopyruvate sulfurtransferase
MSIKYAFLLLIPLGVALVLHSGDDIYPRAGLLVEPAQLKKRSVARQFVILDARTRQCYEQGHVPGAYWVARAAWTASFGTGSDTAAWSRRIGAMGIGAQSRAIVYADDCRDAALVWWLLRYWGVEHAKLLNGGWYGWASCGGSIELRPSLPEPVGFTAHSHNERVATREQVLAFLSEATVQIVDTRSAAEYRGVDKLNNKKGGAIPGARHLEWIELVDAKTQRFKSASELGQLFKQAAVSLDQPTVTYCQAGARASVVVFGMELMGAKNVTNYYRGWGEWGNAQDSPSITEYPDPSSWHPSHSTSQE